jgi:hypothetical protein
MGASFAQLRLSASSAFDRVCLEFRFAYVSLVRVDQGERMIKSLWASVQGNPVFMRRVNGWLTLFWLLMIPVSFATGWVKLTTYVSALSLWALVSGHWSAWQAARVEVNQEREEQRRDEEDVAGDVVERLVKQTDVAPAHE